jgi:hypothetical protein
MAYTLSRYRSTFGCDPNLKDPSTFNEHINHKKLFDRDPLLTQLSDKYEVRQYVSDRVGPEYLTKLYCVTDTPSQFDYSSLPHSFVIKATHGSGWNIIVTDKQQLDYQDTCLKMNSWLVMNYYDIGREWCYKNIPPRIIVEEYLGEKGTFVPWDYKLFCFGGKPRFIQIDFDRFRNHTRSIYDVSWNKIDVALHYPSADRCPDPPRKLDEMLKVAGELSQDLDFVRVDLYEVGSRVVFGEMTHYPGNGFEKFVPSEYDAIFGGYWPECRRDNYAGEADA